MENPFHSALAQLSRATRIKPFDPGLLLLLSEPMRETTISIPLTMDDGSLRMFEGYRVQHNNLRGPYKGGVRYHPQTDINEVSALAFWMTMKTALMDLPLGGGKGGVTVDPKVLSKAELERLSYGWVKGLLPLLGPHMDIPAPDVGTTSEIISYMAETYAALTGDKSGATFTGKPIAKGGCGGRTVATALGGFYTFEALREALSIPNGARIAIQGMGNVGGHAATIFAEHGYQVVALSDSKSGVYSEHGLDVQAVETYKKMHGTLARYPKAQAVSNAKLLELPVDVLIPAALENQITEVNASHVHAKVVLELANGPTTPGADDILHERGSVVVPDILANAGGVVVSSFEWEQNLAGTHWSERVVFEKLQKILVREAKNTLERARKHKTDLRRAAFIIALERLEKAYKTSGR